MEIMLPHRLAFPYRRKILAWTIICCVSAGVIWPGQSFFERAAVLGTAVGLIVLSYCFFRVVLGWFASLASDHFSRLMLMYLLFIFYFGAIIVPLALITLPFQWHDLYVDGMTGPKCIAITPVGLSSAAGAYHAIAKYYSEA